MSILEKQNKEHGDICKWLTCDSSCHMTECALNHARVFHLYDLFRSMNFKYPEVAYEYKETYCTMCNDDYIKNNGFIDTYDEKNDITGKEKDADDIVNSEFTDETQIRRLYVSLKEIYVKKYVESHENEIIKLKKMLEEDLYEDK